MTWFAIACVPRPFQCYNSRDISVYGRPDDKTDGGKRRNALTKKERQNYKKMLQSLKTKESKKTSKEKILSGDGVFKSDVLCTSQKTNDNKNDSKLIQKPSFLTQAQHEDLENNFEFVDSPESIQRTRYFIDDYDVVGRGNKKPCMGIRQFTAKKRHYSSKYRNDYNKDLYISRNSIRYEEPPQNFTRQPFCCDDITRKQSHRVMRSNTRLLEVSDHPKRNLQRTRSLQPGFRPHSRKCCRDLSASFADKSKLESIKYMLRSKQRKEQYNLTLNAEYVLNNLKHCKDVRHVRNVEQPLYECEDNIQTCQENGVHVSRGDDIFVDKTMGRPIKDTVYSLNGKEQYTYCEQSHRKHEAIYNYNARYSERLKSINNTVLDECYCCRRTSDNCYSTSRYNYGKLGVDMLLSGLPPRLQSFHSNTRDMNISYNTPTVIL